MNYVFYDTAHHGAVQLSNFLYLCHFSMPSISAFACFHQIIFSVCINGPLKYGNLVYRHRLLEKYLRSCSQSNVIRNKELSGLLQIGIPNLTPKKGVCSLLQSEFIGCFGFAHLCSHLHRTENILHNKSVKLNYRQFFSIRPLQF